MNKKTRSEMLQLRPYQQICISRIRECFAAGRKRIVLCAPTGAGKTAMFSYMVSRNLEKGGTALVVTDRIELMKQAGGAFNRLGLSPVNITAGSKPDLTHPLHVAMIETLSRRSEAYANFIASKQLIIFDEAHKAAFDKLFPYIHPDAFVIGATATPERKGGQESLENFYGDIVQPIDTPDLIELGFLSDAMTYGIPIDLKGVKKIGGDYDANEMARRFEERRVYEGVIENYKRICPGTKTLAFSANIAQSKSLCDKLTGAGLNARHLDSEMAEWERNETLDWLRSTPDAILCNVGILTTGFDCPDIQTIILYRATTSLPLFLQMVGRGSRVTDTKKTFTILDFGNNIKAHKMWEAPRVWSLAKKPKREKKDAPSVKDCPSCGGLVAASAKTCKMCGWEFKPKRDPKAVNHTVTLSLLPKNERIKELNKLSLEEKAHLCRIDKKSGRKMAGFILHQMIPEEISDAEKFITLLGKSFSWFRTNEARERYRVFGGGSPINVSPMALEQSPDGTGSVVHGSQYPKEQNRRVAAQGNGHGGWGFGYNLFTGQPTPYLP